MFSKSGFQLEDLYFLRRSNLIKTNRIFADSIVERYQIEIQMSTILCLLNEAAALSRGGFATKLNSELLGFAISYIIIYVVDQSSFFLETTTAHVPRAATRAIPITATEEPHPPSAGASVVGASVAGASVAGASVT